MMFVPAGVKVHLALGYTDMRKGMDGLAMLVQDTLKKDPFSGHLFAFRGKKASILKVLFWDGNGLCLFTKRIDQGGSVWPVMAGYDGSITLTPAQLAMLIEGIDWRAPERIWKPAIAGSSAKTSTELSCDSSTNQRVRVPSDMQHDLTNLPSDPELLQHLVRDIAAAIGHRDTEIKRLKSIIKQLQRMQFGRSSERIDPDQLALVLRT